MLRKRVLTAILGIAVAVYVINYGQWLFAITAILLACLAWNEFAAMMYRKQIKVFYTVGLGGIVLLLACAWLGNAQESIMVVTAVMMLVLLRSMLGNGSFSVTDAAFTIAGFLYVSLPFSHMLLLRFLDTSHSLNTSFGMLPQGAAYMWLPFIGTWASDTFAYFIGSQWGKHKLSPAISPKKTIEGAVGGLLGSICVVIAIGNMFQLTVLDSAIIGTLVGIIAPCGDLVESALKRFSGVKDSGRLLPGHGGVLDRFDSIMFVIPVVYYYICLGML